MQMKATLYNLYNFIPQTEEEKTKVNAVWNKATLEKYVNNLQERYANGQFYLGGQLKMKPTDEITMDTIRTVYEINERQIKISPPANSFEIHSVNQHNETFYSFEKMLICYLEIMQNRYNAAKAL